MKSNKILIVFLLLVMLILMLAPTAAMAAGELDVVAWADPMYVNDGDSVTIYIEITNNTGAQVTLSAYGIDNEFYQIGEGTTLANGETTMIEYVYFVNFGSNDSIGVPVQVNHEGSGGSVVLSFAPQVQINRAQDITTVDFVYTPDANGIESGGWINFTIECTNTGNVDYTDFTVTAGGTDVETFDLAVGETATVIFSESYTQDTIQTFGYYFTYMSGGASLSVVQDPATQMNVTVLADAVPTQQPVGDDAQAAPQADTQNEADNPESEQPSEELVAQPALADEQPDESQQQASADADGQTGGLGTLAVVLIAIGAALVSAGIVIAIVFVVRRKSAASSKRSGTAL